MRPGRPAPAGTLRRAARAAWPNSEPRWKPAAPALLDQQRLARATERLARGDYVPANTVASLYLDVGDKASCLDWLDKAAADRDPQLVTLRTFPLWRPLRGEARYESL